MVLQAARGGSVVCDGVREGAPLAEIILARLLGLSGVRDALLRDELCSGEEEVLREHVDDLAAGVVAEPVAQAALPVSPGHPYVEQLVALVDHIYARPGRSGTEPQSTSSKD